MATMVRYMEKLEGRKAVEEMYMPHPHTMKTSNHRATPPPYLDNTALFVRKRGKKY